METHSLHLLLGIVNKGFSFERGPRGDGNSLELKLQAVKETMENLTSALARYFYFIHFAI